MKRKIILTLMIMMCLLISGCGNSAQKDVTPASEEDLKVVRLALFTNGHILTTIADEQGYLFDEGIRVEYVPLDNDFEVFEAIKNGEVDIASNSGTNLPLQYISEGLDLTIFGGYLLTGCMPVFARVETKWNGIEDLIGKTMACEPNLYAISGPLYDMGYDPLNDIKWYESVDQMERIEAVKNGDADFGLVGTSLNYAVLSDPELKIVTYAADVLPDYSCCRAEALTSWVNENPETVKGLLKAWIRALAYYENHHEETVMMTVDLVKQEEDFVRAYLDNPRFKIDPDPMKSAVERAWNYMKDMGLLEGEAETMDIDEHINTSLYKQALDECQEEYGSEYPEFYEKLQAQYAINNID